ncbi:hypothetical protein SUGI_0406880 [Cryptomeria japonica]|nr:hypothetical protein SUGI_0406880 [Cryptomeria japonica]
MKNSESGSRSQEEQRTGSLQREYCGILRNERMYQRNDACRAASKMKNSESVQPVTGGTENRIFTARIL